MDIFLVGLMYELCDDDLTLIAGDINGQPLTDDGLTMIINREAAVSLGYEIPPEIIGESSLATGLDFTRSAIACFE